MRHLYIHIGQPKTGTSSIQRFLVENRDILGDAGLGVGPLHDPEERQEPAAA